MKVLLPKSFPLLDPWRHEFSRRETFPWAERKFEWESGKACKVVRESVTSASELHPNTTSCDSRKWSEGNAARKLLLHFTRKKLFRAYSRMFARESNIECFDVFCLPFSFIAFSLSRNSELNWTLQANRVIHKKIKNWRKKKIYFCDSLQKFLCPTEIELYES